MPLALSNISVNHMINKNNYLPCLFSQCLPLLSVERSELSGNMRASGADVYVEGVCVGNHCISLKGSPNIIQPSNEAADQGLVSVALCSVGRSR